MPRTRSLAWSELKIGIIAVVALVAGRRCSSSPSAAQGGFFWQRYQLKTQVRRRPGPEERRGRPRRRRRGRQGDERRVRRRGRRGRAARSRRRMQSRITDRVARVDRLAEPARRAARRHQPVATGTPLKDGDYIQSARAAGAARRRRRAARRRRSSRSTGAAQGHPRGKGRSASCSPTTTLYTRDQRVRRVGRQVVTDTLNSGKGTLGHADQRSRRPTTR